jgi:hypothetical protein
MAVSGSSCFDPPGNTNLFCGIPDTLTLDLSMLLLDLLNFLSKYAI